MQTKNYFEVSRKLFLRVAIIFIGVIIATAVISSFISVRIDENRTLKTVKNEFSQFATVISLSSQHALAQKHYDFLEQLHREIVNEFPMVLYSAVMDKQGRILTPLSFDQSQFSSQASVKTYHVDTLQAQELYFEQHKTEVLELRLPLKENGKIIGTMVMGFSLKPLRQRWNRLYWDELIVDGILLVWGIGFLGLLMFILRKPVSGLEQQSRVDGLTGLLNHSNFQRILDAELKKAKSRHYTIALLIMDIDDFKKINDTLGHPEGDRVLKGAAEIINNSIRKSDTAARYGGEEFAVILPHCSAHKAYEIAETIRQKIISQGQYRYDRSNRPVTISIGLSIFPQSAQTQRTLIKQADKKLYEAKRNGKNQTVGYEL